jgi:2,4'-dihydroxyacetophenone dioxygenase
MSQTFIPLLPSSTPDQKESRQDSVTQDDNMAPSFATAEAPDSLPAVKPVKVDGHQPVQVDDSTARRVRNNELAELKIAEEMGAPDVYVDSEKDTCWYLWTGSIYCKVLRIENRTGLYVIALKTGPHAELGKHRHRGEVRAYTVGDGHWGYHE